MTNSTSKLKMNITGTFHGIWAVIFIRKKVRDLGLKIDKIEHHNIHHTELILSGDRDKLWKALGTVRTPDYLKMNKIIFEFLR